MPKAYSPNDAEIVATCDLIPANALIVEDSFAHNPDGSLSFDWAGESKMCWDGQYTKHEDGKPLYIDEYGMEWTADEIMLRDRPCTSIQSGPVDPLAQVLRQSDMTRSRPRCRRIQQAGRWD